ncbi:MAG: hypothetical protein JSU70_12365 [Phycisphaerales bacterium]|nr:MAG: hypothetical protein JSU70_12365 [Phycisphaerales bacterium]
MKGNRILTILSVLAVCGSPAVSPRSAAASGESILGRTFDLAGERTSEIQHFVMESRLISYALDGKRVGTDVFRLRLKCVPAKLAGKAGDEYTCVEFTLQLAGAPKVHLPTLEGWTYVFKRTPTNMDEEGQVLGIDHSKFANLADADGKAVPADKAYHVYNAFIDFHAFCNVFAERTAGGKGIQDLTRIGQKIVHAAAFTEPPVNVGSHVSEGSTFKNGEVTLEFKGLSRVDGEACGIVAYDSGESSFKMIVNPAPNMEVRSVGSSHYLGDIYIDLASRWVRKATMYELVVTETTLPMPPNKINAVIEREIIIRNVTEREKP